MRAVKQKAVINAEKLQLERVKKLVDSGRYRTLSEFVREAVDEKLERIAEGRIAEDVERYCAGGHAREDIDIIDSQPFVTPRQRMTAPAKSKGRPRGTR